MPFLISGMKLIRIWSCLCIAVLTLCVAIAQGAPPEASDAKKSKDAKISSSPEEKDKPRPLELTVPNELRNSGTTLVIDGESYPLDKDKVVVKPSLDPVGISLFAADGRLLSHANDYVDEDLFRSTRTRTFRGGLAIGLSMGNASAWKKVFLKGSRFLFSMNGTWQPAAFGLRLGLELQTQSARYAEGYMASHTGAGFFSEGSYEIAIFKNSSGYWRRVMLVPYARLGYASHQYQLSDQYLKETDRSEGMQYGLGVDLRMALAGNFSVVPRYGLQYEPIRWKKFDFDYKSIDQRLLVEMNYAF